MVLLGLHTPALLALALARGFPLGHSVLESLVPLAFLAPAMVGRFSRRVRGGTVAVGLLTCSALLVHLSGGYIEMHFHFFVVVGLLTLYEDWALFLSALVYVLVHHGVVGMVAPQDVFNHPDAIAHPWRWASIHALFIAGASAAGLTNWRLNEQARKRLEDVNEMKNAFLAAVSHELRTPLTIVLGVNLMLEESWEHFQDAERRTLISRASSNAQQLDALLRDLLDLDRLSRNMLEPRRSPVDLSRLVRGCVDRISTATGRAIALTGSPVIGDVDAAQVERIVENLLVNAAKYTPSTAGIAVAFEARDGGVRITVADEGPGIESALHGSIFEPFNRADRRDANPGAGIGLTLVSQFARLHGGRAWVEDRAGGGAVFCVFLRCTTMPVEQVSEHQAAV